MEAQVVGEDDNQVAAGDVGEMRVREISVTRGYWGKEQETKTISVADGIIP